MQTELIRSVARSYKITGTKATIPLDKNYFAGIKNEEEPTNERQYQSIVRELLYILKITHPEALIQINLLGR